MASVSILLREEEEVEIPRIATTLAALESLRNQQHNLEEMIGRLVALMKQLPEGESRRRPRALLL